MKTTHIVPIITLLSLIYSNNSLSATQATEETARLSPATGPEKIAEYFPPASESEAITKENLAVLTRLDNKQQSEQFGGLEDKQRSTMATTLNILLANEYVLYTKTLKFHWNVRGKHFGALHEFFKKQYEQLLTITDRVAERVRALGKLSLGTLQEFIAQADVPEEPNNNPRDMGMIQQLLTDHERIIQLMHEYSDLATENHDDATVNMLGDLLEEHEKMAWMLRAHLE